MACNEPIYSPVAEMTTRELAEIVRPFLLTDTLLPRDRQAVDALREIVKRADRDPFTRPVRVMGAWVV